MELRFLLGGLVIAFNFMDNTTTFLCLQAPVAGFEVIEANPFARWLFDSVGLLEGLVFETLVSTAAVCFLVLTPILGGRARMAILAVLVLLPAAAVVNNLQVIDALGITWVLR